MFNIRRVVNARVDDLAALAVSLSVPDGDMPYNDIWVKAVDSPPRNIVRVNIQRSLRRRNGR